MTAESNPRQVFERLFGVGAPGQRAENLRRRRLEQRSILDFVMQDARAMQRRLNTGDQAKLDQYLTGVRELEVAHSLSRKIGRPKRPDDAHAQRRAGDSYGGTWTSCLTF